METALLPYKGITTVHRPHGSARKVLGFQERHKQLLCSGLVAQRKPDAAQMSVRELKLFLQVQSASIQSRVNRPKSIATCIRMFSGTTTQFTHVSP